MCKKSCLLWVFEDEIISRKDIHNHPPDDAEIEVEFMKKYENHQDW